MGAARKGRPFAFQPFVTKLLRVCRADILLTHQRTTNTPTTMNTYRIHMSAAGLKNYSILVGAKSEAHARKNMEQKVRAIAHIDPTIKIIGIELTK